MIHRTPSAFVRRVLVPPQNNRGRFFELHAGSRLLRPAAPHDYAVGRRRDRARDRLRRVPREHEPRAARAARSSRGRAAVTRPVAPAGIRAAHHAAHVRRARRLAGVHASPTPTLAAKSRRAEQVLMPMLDILQSVPILGFLSITVVFFHRARSRAACSAPRCAAIFAIFTSQAWNMAFSFYQSLRTVPARAARGGADRSSSRPGMRFWRLEVPFAMPGLVWNMMMSMSGGWFFVVASEAITRRRHHDRAAGHRLLHRARDRAARTSRAIGWAIVDDARRDPALRPAAVPAARRLGRRVPLRAGPRRASRRDSWVLDAAAPLAAARAPCAAAFARAVRWARSRPARCRAPRRGAPSRAPRRDAACDSRSWLADRRARGVALLAHRRVLLEHDARLERRRSRVRRSALLTLLRVFVLIALASADLGADRRLDRAAARARRRCVQPLAQFLAAFPANLLFPLVVCRHRRLAASTRTSG